VITIDYICDWELKLHAPVEQASVFWSLSTTHLVSDLFICHWHAAAAASRRIRRKQLTRKKGPQDTRWQSVIMLRWLRWLFPSSWPSTAGMAPRFWTSTSWMASSSVCARLLKRGRTSLQSIRRSLSKSIHTVLLYASLSGGTELISWFLTWYSDVPNVRQCFSMCHIYVTAFLQGDTKNKFY